MRHEDAPVIGEALPLNVPLTPLRLVCLLSRSTGGCTKIQCVIDTAEPAILGCQVLADDALHHNSCVRHRFAGHAVTMQCSRIRLLCVVLCVTVTLAEASVPTVSQLNVTK